MVWSRRKRRRRRKGWEMLEYSMNRTLVDPSVPDKEFDKVKSESKSESMEYRFLVKGYSSLGSADLKVSGSRDLTSGDPPTD